MVTTCGQVTAGGQSPKRAIADSRSLSLRIASRRFRLRIAGAQGFSVDYRAGVKSTKGPC
jgi:hypothetical protein